MFFIPSICSPKMSISLLYDFQILPHTHPLFPLQMLCVSTHTEKIELNVREETMMMSMTTYELCVLCVFLTFCTLYKPGNVIFKGKVGHWKLKFFTSTFQADMLRLERVLSFNNNTFFVLLTLRIIEVGFLAHNKSRASHWRGLVGCLFWFRGNIFCECTTILFFIFDV